MAYFTKVTETGATVIAAAIAAGVTVPIAQLCVGDGNGSDHEPVGTETALVHQVWAGAVTGMSSEGDTLTVEAVIPHNVGGFTIREIGILDSDGALIAIGNYPETLKPAADDGGLVEILIRMIVKFETDISGVIEITIDPGSVYATRNYADQAADDAVLEHANVTNPHSSTPEATALRLVLRDANGRAKFGAGSDGSDAVIMSQLLEHAGLANTHGSTPEATALRLVLRNANGRAKFGAGLDNDDAVIMSQLLEHAGLTNPHGGTPDATALRMALRDENGRAKFAGGVSGSDAVVWWQFRNILEAETGYMLFPGGFTIQWGVCVGHEDTWAARNYPLAFSQPLGIVGSGNAAYFSLDVSIQLDLLSNTQFRVATDNYGSNTVRWIAVGIIN